MIAGERRGQTISGNGLEVQDVVAGAVREPATSEPLSPLCYEFKIQSEIGNEDRYSCSHPEIGAGGATLMKVD